MVYRIELEKLRETVEKIKKNPEEEIQRIERLARERCPVVFCITNPIKLESDLVIER